MDRRAAPTIMLIVACVAAIACRRAPSSPSDALTATPAETADDFVVIVSGDTTGWLAPCGCASNQSGGLLRRGTFAAEQAQKNKVLVVDAGGAPGGVSAYDRLKFAAILRGEQAMGLAAHNLGGPELRLGIEFLKATASELGITFLSANVRSSSGDPVGKAYKRMDIGGRQILLIGVVSEKFATADCTISEPGEAILSVLREQPAPVDAVIVLAYLTEPELRELAAALPEVHAVIGGPTGQSIAPVKIGPCWLASATNKGKFLVRLTLSENGKVADWRADVVELTDRFIDHPAQRENLKQFRSILEMHDLSTAESGFAVASQNISTDYRIAGSDSCRECHADDHQHWQSSAHAHAWQSLAKDGAQFDADCQRCHTTGFGLPDGFVSTKRSEHRVNVGCESCHGPSRAHAEQPQMKTLFIAQDQCVRCHDRENSPNFDFAEYWPKILHGSAAGQIRTAISPN